MLVSLPLPCLTCQDFSNSSPFCFRDKHQLAAGIWKPCQTLVCHSPYGLSERLRVSAQKAVCDLVSFLSLSLDDESFEYQDASHLASLCSASEFSDLNFTSERTAIYLSQKQSLCLHACSFMQSDMTAFHLMPGSRWKSTAAEENPGEMCPWPWVLHLLSTNGCLPLGVLEIGGWPNGLMLISSWISCSLQSVGNIYGKYKEDSWEKEGKWARIMPSQLHEKGETEGPEGPRSPRSF